MPTDPNPPEGRAWSVGCVLHAEGMPRAPMAEVRVNGKRVRALVDTGSSVSLAQPGILPTRFTGKARLPVTCIHGDKVFTNSHRQCDIRLGSVENGGWSDIGTFSAISIRARLAGVESILHPCSTTSKPPEGPKTKTTCPSPPSDGSNGK